MQQNNGENYPKLLIWTSSSAGVLTPVFGPILKNKPWLTHAFWAIDASEPVPAPKPGQVLLACGSKAMDLLKSEKFLPKNLGILKQRETAHPVQDGGHIFVTFDPQSCASEPANKALIQ